MSKSKKLVVFALAGLMAAGTAIASEAEKGKCFGVAKAGQNDCSPKNKAHACKGKSTVDNSMDDFKFATRAECEALNGKYLSVPAKPLSK